MYQCEGRLWSTGILRIPCAILPACQLEAGGPNLCFYDKVSFYMNQVYRVIAEKFHIHHEYRNKQRLGRNKIV